ncbi:MAG: DUF5990 family protein [Acidimicrobiales bacterium]
MTIEGFDMPGRACAPGGAGERYENVHVGVQRRREVVDLVPGDAPAASWSFEITLRLTGAAWDAAGPHVQGRPGERFVYLSWGTVGPDFQMFRRAKLAFADCPGEVLATAAAGAGLRCRVRMTDACGHPRCARVRHPDAAWSATPP